MSTSVDAKASVYVKVGRTKKVKLGSGVVEIPVGFTPAEDGQVGVHLERGGVAGEIAALLRDLADELDPAE